MKTSQTNAWAPWPETAPRVSRPTIVRIRKKEMSKRPKCRRDGPGERVPSAVRVRPMIRQPSISAAQPLVYRGVAGCCGLIAAAGAARTAVNPQ